MADTAEYEIRTETTTTTVADDGTSLPLYVARPDRPGPHAGVIVIQEIFGVNAHIRDVTNRFARAGYTAVAPVIFHRTDPTFEGSYTDHQAAMPHAQALTPESLSADLRAAYAWLTSPDLGQATAVASVGYCLGGRTSFLAATVTPLTAAVSYYGGRMALERAGDVACPMLFFWGGKDKGIPLEQVRATEDAMVAAGKPYTSVVFSEAEHGFFCDARAAYNPDAARQAWAHTLAFLASHIGA